MTELAEEAPALPWSLFVAMALTGSRPARIKAGIVMSPPPPAMASTVPCRRCAPLTPRWQAD